VANNSYPSAPIYKAVRTTNHLYVEYGSEEREMYDLTADPYELENLAGREAYAILQAELRARLNVLKGCVGDGCRIAEAGR
jgi:N-acetylglucosamine-6-sulfatase